MCGGARFPLSFRVRVNLATIIFCKENPCGANMARQHSGALEDETKKREQKLLLTKKLASQLGQ